MAPDFDAAEHRRAQDQRHRDRFPAHHAIVDYYAAHDGESIRPLQMVLQEIMARDPSTVRKIDENGLTPLHVAAQCQCLDSVRALLNLAPGPIKRGTIYEDLKRCDNVKGMTPADFCAKNCNAHSEWAFMQMMFGNPPSDSLLPPTSDERADCLKLLREAEKELDGPE